MKIWASNKALFGYTEQKKTVKSDYTVLAKKLSEHDVEILQLISSLSMIEISNDVYKKAGLVTNFLFQIWNQFMRKIY